MRRQSDNVQSAENLGKTCASGTFRETRAGTSRKMGDEGLEPPTSRM
jgi:hypothetical protein